MKFNLSNGTSIDTGKQLRPEERHIVQKLLAWTDTVDSVARFRELKKRALADGWNNSGQVLESRVLSLIANDLEARIRQRLKNRSSDLDNRA
jgi:hypothetical protein